MKERMSKSVKEPAKKEGRKEETNKGGTEPLH
jgi:hypothetical protein